MHYDLYDIHKLATPEEANKYMYASDNEYCAECFNCNEKIEYEDEATPVGIVFSENLEEYSDENIEEVNICDNCKIRIISDDYPQDDKKLNVALREHEYGMLSDDELIEMFNGDYLTVVKAFCGIV